MSPRQTRQCKRGARRRRRKCWWGAGPAGGTPAAVDAGAAVAVGGRWMSTGAGGWGRDLGQSDLSEEAGGWPRSTAGSVAGAENEESSSRLAGRWSESGGTGGGLSRRSGQAVGASS